MNTPLKTAFIALAALGLGRLSSYAQAEAAFALKHRSEFNATGAHNPFWPIGWVKRQAAAPQQVLAEPVAKFTLDEKSFKVTSILLGHRIAGRRESSVPGTGRAPVNSPIRR